MEQLNEQERLVNQVMSTMSWCDCEIIPGGYGDLVVAVSEDLSYYHTLEINFHNVDFSAIKQSFSVDPGVGLFKLITQEEMMRINKENGVTSGSQLFRLADEDGAMFYVAAERITIGYDTVLHYYREDLQPGQRIASWVAKL